MEWYEIPEKLEAGRVVFVTDGTVTRRVLKAEWHGLELQLMLDTGKSLWLSADEFENSGDQKIGIMDNADGLYIAPLWWINLGGKQNE